MTGGTTMAQLTCKNLTLGYDNRAIQEDLNFSIDAGDYLCIVGENGSGKSTLMKTLLHLQPPISGTIGLGDGLKKNEIGYLPQQTLVQRDFPASVREIVLSGCQSRCGLRPFYNKEEKRVAQKAMEKMMIQDLADHCYRELSGGQQQRVALARIMAYEPSVILLDEPFSALDVFLKDRLQQEMMELLSDYDGTVILVSHSRDEIYRFSEELLVIDDGKQICYGDTKAIFDCPEQVEAARLTGCKNIVQVKKLDEHSIEIPDWGTKLHLEQEIDAEITHIGLRAHEFIPVWGRREDNCIPVKEKGNARISI